MSRKTLDELQIDPKSIISKSQNVMAIDRRVGMKCYTCDGKGVVSINKIISSMSCATCKGTGLWKEDNFHLIAQTPEGQCIAFQVDSPGK